MTLDPNIRPTLPGSHRELLEQFESLLGLADLVKLSDDDFSWLYPNLDIDRILRRILALRPSIAVATNGASGSVLASQTAKADIASIMTTVADTIGAGDS